MAIEASTKTMFVGADYTMKYLASPANPAAAGSDQVVPKETIEQMIRSKEALITMSGNNVALTVGNYID